MTPQQATEGSSAILAQPNTSAHAPKVLLLTTTAEIGGTERVAISLTRVLRAEGWRVRAVFPRIPGSEALLTWCNAQGVQAEVDAAVLPVTALHTLRDLLSLCSFIRRSSPTIVHLQYGSSFISLKDVLAVRLSGRRRCVVTVHHPASWSNMSSRKAAVTRLAAYLCDAVVVVSRATRDILLQAKVPPQKIHIIPNGVRIPQSQPIRADARARLGVPLDTFVISCLGRLISDKGIADLIAAAAEVYDPQGMLRIIIAGDGPDRQMLEELAASRLGHRAVFLGRVPDTADIYAAADVFALPSYLEGFGLVFIEAAFHGIPSIGTTAGGIPDAVVDDKTGVLIPPGDIPAITGAIERLRGDAGLRQRLGDAARARAYAEFTEAHMVDRYKRVYES